MGASLAAVILDAHIAYVMVPEPPDFRDWLLTHELVEWGAPSTPWSEMRGIARTFAPHEEGERTASVIVVDTNPHRAALRLEQAISPDGEILSGPIPLHEAESTGGVSG